MIELKWCKIYQKQRQYIYLKSIIFRLSRVFHYICYVAKLNLITLTIIMFLLSSWVMLLFICKTFFLFSLQKLFSFFSNSSKILIIVPCGYDLYMNIKKISFLFALFFIFSLLSLTSNLMLSKLRKITITVLCLASTKIRQFCEFLLPQNNFILFQFFYFEFATKNLT